MGLYQRIQVPVDGGSPAFYALDHAIAIARDQGARLQLVTVLDQGVADYRGAEVGWVGSERLHDELLAQAQAALKQAEARVHAGAPELEVETKVVEAPQGEIWKRILQVAGDWGADLLVVGTHGRHGLDRVLLGSVSETLVRHGRLPVLVVPADTGAGGGGA